MKHNTYMLTIVLAATFAACTLDDPQSADDLGSSDGLEVIATTDDSDSYVVTAEAPFAPDADRWRHATAASLEEFVTTDDAEEEYATATSLEKFAIMDDAEEGYATAASPELEAQALACDPNEDCTRRGPNYPCPTWRNPGRTCPSYYDDPVCLARRAACQGTLIECVAGIIGASAYSPGCYGCIVANFAVGGVALAACIVPCGITAAGVQEIVQSCG